MPWDTVISKDRQLTAVVVEQVIWRRTILETAVQGGSRQRDTPWADAYFEAQLFLNVCSILSWAAGHPLLNEEINNR